MTKLICLLTMMLFAGIMLKAQQPDAKQDEYIEWNEFYKLKWDDFQAPQALGRFGAAGTAVQIKAKPYLVSKKLMYDVFVFFLKKESWCSEKSDMLLAHEQLHFDIAELYARKVRKKIIEMRDQHIEDVHTINNAIQVILNESNEADKQYDKDTLHGALTDKQNAWTEKIKKELLDLTVYKKNFVFTTSNY